MENPHGIAAADAYARHECACHNRRKTWAIGGFSCSARPAMTRMNAKAPAAMRTWATAQTISTQTRVRRISRQRRLGFFHAGASPHSTCPTKGVFRSRRCRVIVRLSDLGTGGAARYGGGGSCGFRRRPLGRAGRATGSLFAPVQDVGGERIPAVCADRASGFRGRLKASRRPLSAHAGKIVIDQARQIRA